MTDQQLTIENFNRCEPGIYSGIPGEAYHSLREACSNSRLTDFLESPELCRYRMDNPMKATDAMDFGSGTHTWLLEPEEMARQFVITTQCCATKKDGARCVNAGIYREDGEWFCGVRGHKPDEPEDVKEIVIKQEAFDAMQQIRDRVMLHPKAGKLIESAGENELSIIERHEPTNLLCKMRPDIARTAVGVFADLKTTVCAAKRPFERAIFERGYFRQAAMYTKLAQQAGLNVDHFVFIAVEKKPPYCVATYRILDDALEEGWREIERLLGEYKECNRSGVWPGYSDDITPIGLPEWAWYHLPRSAEPEWPEVAS